MKVCLDSRLIRAGDYFVPIKGIHFDGYDFIDAAIDAGAAGILEEKKFYKLAQKQLRKTKPVIVGVAGSVGKSTARAYLTQILSTKKRVLEGTLNTKLGLSLNIVNNLTDQNIMVAELGIDKLGEMKEVTDFLKPDFVMLTKLEKEHLQFLKNIDNVIGENLIAIRNSNRKLGYVNSDDKELMTKKVGEIIYYSLDDLTDDLKKIINDLGLPKHDQDYLAGIYKIVRDHFDFSKKDFIQGLRKIKKLKGRLKLIQGAEKCLIVDDSYNAVCDESVIRGIEYATRLSKERKTRLTIFLSPLRETGKSKKDQHKRIAEFLNKVESTLVLVGDEENLYSRYLKKKYQKIANSENYIAKLNNQTIYVKGSQFYRMEKIVCELMLDKTKAKDLLVRQDKRWQ
jgi:UDP-N-acetylmuramoyl-tripeptide--D-alanyl-D-alanine ligase